MADPPLSQCAIFNNKSDENKYKEKEIGQTIYPIFCVVTSTQTSLQYDEVPKDETRHTNPPSTLSLIFLIYAYMQIILYFHEDRNNRKVLRKND